MSEESTKTANDELRPEYRREDLGPGERGKYFERYHSASNVVVLEPDVAEAFPNAEAVNRGLRVLMARQAHQER